MFFFEILISYSLIVKLFKTFSCKKLIVLLQLNFLHLKKQTKHDCMIFIDSTTFFFVYKKYQSNIGTNSKEELSRINAQAQKAGPTSAKKVLNTLPAIKSAKTGKFKRDRSESEFAQSSSTKQRAFPVNLTHS